ncbi:MAG: hypothetical protein OES57_08450 [Acidimicrobiia bacterium]|nr:hypothetical protein [Acidimicrobiia bacterium]
MPASIHIADVPVRRVPGLLARRLKPANTPGLRSAGVGLASPLGPATFPRPSLRRVGLVAFWDDDEAIDHFEQHHPVADALAGGFHTHLRPLRAHGAWPGLDTDVPTGRATESEGPFVVVTLGRMRPSQAWRFFRTSARAEAALADADGLIWATGFGLPPFVATCSLWPDTKSVMAYAYGRQQAAHREAIAEGERQAFHRQQAFVRFEPTTMGGSLGGTNPLPADAVAAVAPT